MYIKTNNLSIINLELSKIILSFFLYPLSQNTSNKLIEAEIINKMLFQFIRLVHGNIE